MLGLFSHSMLWEEFIEETVLPPSIVVVGPVTPISQLVKEPSHMRKDGGAPKPIPSRRALAKRLTEEIGQLQELIDGDLKDLEIAIQTNNPAYTNYKPHSALEIRTHIKIPKQDTKEEKDNKEADNDSDTEREEDDNEDDNEEDTEIEEMYVVLKVRDEKQPYVAIDDNRTLFLFGDSQGCCEFVLGNHSPNVRVLSISHDLFYRAAVDSPIMYRRSTNLFRG